VLPDDFDRIDVASHGARRLEPALLTIPNAVSYSGLSRSEIYRRLATGDINAVKAGSRTLVSVASLRVYLQKLPRATFRPAPSTDSGA
jgi:hypothetical protein